MARTALGIVQNYFPKVRRVVDAKRAVSIEVTSGDSKSGKVKRHESCAYAEACKRQLNADGILVSVSRAYVVYGDKAVKHDIPESVAREIVTFDRGGEFKPGTYMLSKPSKSHRLGRKERGPHLVTTERKRKGFRHQTDGVRTALR